MGPPNHITLKQQHEPPLSFFLSHFASSSSTQVFSFIFPFSFSPHVLPSHINSWQQQPLQTSGSQTLSTQMAAISLYLMFPRDNDNNIIIINNLCILSTDNMYVMQTTLTLCSILFFLSISNQFICVLQHHQCTAHSMIVFILFLVQYIEHNIFYSIVFLLLRCVLCELELT